MGHSFGIKCTECDYTKNFRLGIGMMYSPYALCNFDSEFALLPYLIKSKKTQELVKSHINTKNGSFADGYGHTLYRCSKRAEFYERFFFHIDHDDGSFEPTFKCTRCKTKLKPFLDFVSKAYPLNLRIFEEHGVCGFHQDNWIVCY